MTHIEHIGTDLENRRELYVLELATPDHLPPEFGTAGKYSTILIAWDATGVCATTISRFAQRLIELGGVFFCTWGPDCERVHDVIDEQWVGDGKTITTDPTLMTTWHDDDSLADAIWFALYNGLPIDTYYDECRSVIAITMDGPQWASEIRAAFMDTQQFSIQLHGSDDE